MKWLPVLCYLGVAAWQIGTHLDALWPQDPGKREALRLCYAANHRFNPMDDAAREACVHDMKAANILGLGVTASERRSGE